MNRENGTEQTIDYSVIVPVYNGAETIVRCLNALVRQSIASERYEIIVVDDGSNDATSDNILRWQQQVEPLHFTLIQKENGGAASARNHGAEIAKAPLLFFTDSDCAPTAKWIQTLAAPFADTEVVGVKGSYLTDQTELMAKFVQSEYEDRYDRMGRHAQIDFIDTYSAAYRRNIFHENNGFDTSFAFNEDQEFSFRLSEKGYRLLFVPEAQVYHYHNHSVGQYWRRKFNTGFWKSLITRAYPQHMVQDTHTPQVLKLQIILVGMLLGVGVLSFAGFFWPPARWLWGLLGAIIIGFLFTTVPFERKLYQRSLRLALIGPFFLLIRALSLGCGFLLGTIHFSDTSPERHQPVIPAWKRVVKRMVDVGGALVGLCISIPFVLLAAIAIKLDSPGPVLYWQVRIGENGRPFRMVKLRSMVYNAEEQLEKLVDLESLPEPVYKLENDPRVTRVGRVLRRISLDETPQFYNVLKGDMSLVGPRPEEVRVVALYKDPQRRRLALKPGMTGPMQINGRGDLNLSQRLSLELDYIDNYSIWRDFNIMIRTLPVILRGNGAY